MAQENWHSIPEGTMSRLSPYGTLVASVSTDAATYTPYTTISTTNSVVKRLDHWTTPVCWFSEDVLIYYRVGDQNAPGVFCMYNVRTDTSTDLFASEPDELYDLSLFTLGGLLSVVILGNHNIIHRFFNPNQRKWIESNAITEACKELDPISINCHCHNPNLGFYICAYDVRRGRLSSSGIYQLNKYGDMKKIYNGDTEFPMLSIDKASLVFAHQAGINKQIMSIDLLTGAAKSIGWTRLTDSYMLSMSGSLYCKALQSAETSDKNSKLINSGWTYVKI